MGTRNWGIVVGIATSYRLDILRFESWQEPEIFSSPKTIHSVSGAHPTSYSLGSGVLSWGYNGWGMKLTTHLHLMVRFRMSGAIPLLCLYTLVMWTGTTLPFRRLDWESVLRTRSMCSSSVNRLQVRIVTYR
jgi:hypothetical protein